MSAPAETSFSVDRRALARAFNRAATSYDATAWLQRQARLELLERLQFFALQPRCLLDLGAGTCQAADALGLAYPQARVVAIDLAPGMLAAAPRHWWRRHRFERVCADARALPLADACIDLVFSNLMLQWCDRPDLLFRELARVLKPGGLFTFSSFGPESLHELREAWAAADDGVHVSEFPDMPQLGDALTYAGFVEPVMDVEQHTRHYSDAYALMRELKRIGAHNAAGTRARGLTGRSRMRAMADTYERLRAPRGLPATYQLVFGAAFRGSNAPGSDAQAGPTGEHVVALDSLRRHRR